MGRILMNNRQGVVVDFNPRYGAIVQCDDFDEPVLVSIQALGLRYPCGVKPGQVIRFTSQITASDVEVLENELAPFERGKIIQEHHTFVVIEVDSATQQRLMLDRPTIIANQKDGGWGYELGAMHDDGASLVDLEVEFRLGTFFDERQGDRKVAKDVQPHNNLERLYELRSEFLEMAYAHTFSYDMLHPQFCHGGIVVRLKYGSSPFDWVDVTIYTNSNLSNLLEEAVDWRDNALHLN